MKKVIKENITRTDVENLVRTIMNALSTANLVSSDNSSAVQTAVQTAVDQVARTSANLMAISPQQPTVRENKMKLSIKELRNMIREAIQECGYMDEMGEGGAMEEVSLKRDELKETVERKKAERAEMNKRITEKDLSVTVAQLRAVASLSDKQKEKFMDCIKDGHSVADALRKCK